MNRPASVTDGGARPTRVARGSGRHRSVACSPLMAGCTGKIGAMASGSAGASNRGHGHSAGSGAGGGQRGGTPTARPARAAPVSAGIRTRSRLRRRPPCWWRRPGWRGSAGSSGRTPSATCSS